MQGDRVMADGGNYAAETQRRVSRLIKELGRLRQGMHHDLESLISQLQEQSLASQKADFSGIARLARDMTDCLKWASQADGALRCGTIDALVDACQCIRLHADAVAVGLYGNASGHPRQQTKSDGLAQSPSEGRMDAHSRRPRRASADEFRAEEDWAAGS